MNVADNISFLRKSIPGNVKIVAVSKLQPIDLMMEAYHAGQRAFGENKAQELARKKNLMPEDTEWHFIGHLQTNKVKSIAPFVNLIQSIDSLNLLAEVNREAIKNNRVIACLLQFHIAVEETKFGLDLDDAKALLGSESYGTLQNIRITGVMGMGSFSDDSALVRIEFERLREYFHTLKSVYFRKQPDFEVISMGMSGDYMLAISEGSTMIRIGTAIFGNRNY